MGTIEEKNKKWIQVADVDALKCRVLAATCKVLSTEMQAYLIMAEFLSMMTDLAEGELSDERVSDKMFDMCNIMKSFIRMQRNTLKPQLNRLKNDIELEIVAIYGCDCILYDKDGVVAVISAEGEVTAMKF